MCILIKKKVNLSVYLCYKMLAVKAQNLMSVLEAKAGALRCLLRFLDLCGSESWAAGATMKLLRHAQVSEQFSSSPCSVVFCPGDLRLGGVLNHAYHVVCL